MAVAAMAGRRAAPARLGLNQWKSGTPPPPLVVPEEAEAAGRARAGCADGGFGAPAAAHCLRALSWRKWHIWLAPAADPPPPPFNGISERV